MLFVPFGVLVQTSAGEVPEPVFRVPLAQQEAAGGRRPPFLNDVDERVKRLPLVLATGLAGGAGAGELLLGISRGAPDTSTISQHMAKARSARIVHAIRIPKA